jgi:hypothetical protein
MDKNDNVQPPPTSTGETPATGATGTPSAALGTPGFLQSIQRQFESMGDDAGSFLVGRYTKFLIYKYRIDTIHVPILFFHSLLIHKKKQWHLQIQNRDKCISADFFFSFCKCMCSAVFHYYY